MRQFRVAGNYVYRKRYGVDRILDSTFDTEVSKEMQNDDSPSDLTIAVRTLVTGGFILESVERKPGYALLHMLRYDEFGATHRYCFVLAETCLGTAQVAAARISAQHHHEQLVLIGPEGNSVPTIEWDRFLSLFGGAIFSSGPLEADFGNQLVALGHNQLPDGLQGKADDLFEAYVRAALEFMLGQRVIRYGQDRRFEARPDGIVLPHKNFSALYDAKAYSEGYQVDLDSIRQFKSYVTDFTQRYHAYLPRLNAFIVLSGTFPHRDQTLAKRSRDLFAECGVPLIFLTADSLAEIIRLLAMHPAARSAINWPRIFADPIIRPIQVQDELSAVLRDGIISR
jgi:hypothetical protein